MKLSFDKRQRLFLLARVGDVPSEKLKAVLASSDWTAYRPGVHATHNPQAAVRFRRFADAAAERIFSRAFVRCYPLPSVRLPGILDPHQVDGVRWVLSRSRSYLAHAPGAGKTLQAIVAALWATDDAATTAQAVFIVPPSLAVNWEREILKFMAVLRPDAWPAITIVPDSARQESTGWGADFLIVPDSLLTRPWVLDRLKTLTPRLLAVDEASRFKDPRAARTVALFGGRTKTVRSPGLVHRAKHAVLLDGSPMPNRPMELWAPTYAMAPEAIDFMSEKQFGFRYCGAVMNDRGQWEFKRASREDELRAKLQKNFMHVVREEDLEHPERLRSLVFLRDERTPTHRAWERRHLSGQPLSALMDQPDRGLMSGFRHEVGLAKVPAAVRYIRERLDSGEAVLAFAWHRDVVFALADAFKNERTLGVIVGGVSARDREQALADFQSGRSNLLVLNIAAGGRGHNIQRADRIVFVEPSWTDELNRQCEKRASRRGRAKDLPVKSDYLVVSGSIDEAVMSAVFTKQRTVRRVIG